MAERMDFSDVALTPAMRLDTDEFRLLWVDDWYDGLLAGMSVLGGERLYLELHDRSVLGDRNDPWCWVVLRLSAAALAEQERQHALFAHHVGEHWCSHRAPHLTIEGARSFPFFYEQKATSRALTRADCEVIGWLDAAPLPEASGTSPRP